MTDKEKLDYLKIAQNTILKIYMSKIKEGNGTAKIIVGNKFYNKKIKTLNNESELFRIVKHLRKYYIENNIEIEKDIDNIERYPLIQDLLSVKINKGSKGWFEKNGKEITIQYYSPDLIDKDGNKIRAGELITEISFKRLIVSSSHARNKKVIYINERLYNDAMEILLCGMPDNMEVKAYSKFSSHFGLCTTDGIPLKELPKFVVVPDVIFEIKENFDIVEEYEENKYRVQKNKKTSTKNTVSDGGGLIDCNYMKKIAEEELNLSYAPSSALVRAIPGIKGNLYTFPLKEFFEDKKDSISGNIKDVWFVDGNGVTNGSLHNFEKENIVAVIPKSMFKFWDKYSSYEEWYNAFNTTVKGYKRTFNICAVAEDYKNIEETVPLSYQPLQTLNLDENRILKLCQPTVKNISRIASNVDEFIKYRGINKNKNNIPEYYKALAANKCLWYDSWIQKKVQQDLDGIKKRAYLGGIDIEGNYQVLGYDLTLLAEQTFGLKPKGVLKAGEVYSQYWFDKDVKDILLIRYPHVSHEWRLVNIAKISTDPQSDMRYLRYQYSTILASGKDSLYQRLGGADVDNDHCCCINSQVLKDAVAKAKEFKNTVIPILYEKPVAKTPKGNIRKKKAKTIDNIDALIKTDCDAMTANIGNFVNKVTILWSILNDDKAVENISVKIPEAILNNTAAMQEYKRNKIIEYIKQMLIISSKCIDFAKTGIPAKITDKIKEILDDNKELPIFMKYRYPQKYTDEKRLIYNAELIDGEIDPEYLFKNYDCTMNRLCLYLEKNISDIKVNAPKGKCIDYNIFYNKRPDKYKSVFYKSIFELMEELQKEFVELSGEYKVNEFDTDEVKEENINRFKLFYDYCKNSLLSICPNIDKLVDILVFLKYEDDKFEYKDGGILWNCFGTILRNRINGTEIPVVEINTEKKAEKSKSKKQKLGEVKLFVKEEKKRDAKEKDITTEKLVLTKNERNYIRENARQLEEVKILTTLWAISKLCKNNNAKFKVYSGGKDKKKIKRSDILRLSGIKDYRKFDEYIKYFLQKGYVKFENKKYYYTVDVPVKAGNGDLETIHNINDINKIFKKVC